MIKVIKEGYVLVPICLFDFGQYLALGGSTVSATKCTP